jgi:hypothetical protein
MPTDAVSGSRAATSRAANRTTSRSGRRSTARRSTTSSSSYFEEDWTIRYAYRLPLAAVADHHTQPGRQGCRLMITNDSPWRSDPRADRLR